MKIITRIVATSLVHAVESSYSFLSCSERESMTKNQDANNQEIEVPSTSSDKGSIEIDEFGDSNDDSLRGTSSTISNLGNNSDDQTQENNMNLSECEATESITVSSDESEKITKAKDKDGTYRKQDDISHNGRSFSINDDVNFIREAVSQILTTPTGDDSSNTQSVTNEIVQDEEPPKTDHIDGREQNSTNSLYKSLRHRDSQLETMDFVANNTITKSKFEPP
ncbi:hypothetical protein RDI58_022144 [Solanum bulbocastanum]|uniref:Uncharacterized protein n=1 Tax=Solanum bulbocastanum TaxID=147425 RepID=A0AAN8T1I1_SOLBU